MYANAESGVDFLAWILQKNYRFALEKTKFPRVRELESVCFEINIGKLRVMETFFSIIRNVIDIVMKVFVLLLHK